MSENDDTPPDNETMREVKRAKARKEGAEDSSKESGGLGWKTAAGIGIGSAALAAALIYASKARKKDD
jgi:hypothetical protein